MSYLGDILEQPTVLRAIVEAYKEHPFWQTLQTKMAAKPYHRVVLTGMGSSYYALFPTWLCLNQQRLPAIHIEASELIHYGLGMLDEHTLVVVVSQSGESIEIRRLVEAVKGKVTLISLTNTENNFLASHSDFSLFTQAGSEVPVATKTYTGCLALLHLLTQSLIKQLQPQTCVDLIQLSDHMASLLENWSQWLDPVIPPLQSVDFYTLLGRGPAVSSAMTGALILKEAARLNAVGLSGGQFRHGPMEALSPAMGVILFANPGQTSSLSGQLAADIHQRGGVVVLVGAPEAPAGVSTLALPRVDEYLSPILEIVAVQLLAARLASEKGIVPGKFRWSGKVIKAE